MSYTFHDIIRSAYERGYRVTEQGKLLGLTKELPIKLRGIQRYPTFSFNRGKGQIYGIPVHKLAAYCFYGDISFEHDCVIHLDRNTLNNSKSNIKLGTHSENAFTVPLEQRVNAARKARASQGRSPKNSKFTEYEVRFIRYTWLSSTELAQYFNVTKQCIGLIRHGKNYSHIQPVA